jgi:hypothetical protein
MSAVAAGASTPLKWYIQAGRVLLAGSVLVFTIISILSAVPRGNLNDLEAFLASARAAGLGLNPYDLQAIPHELPPQYAWGYNPNLNPPVSLVLFASLPRSDPYTLYVIWWGISFLLYVSVVGWLVKVYRPAWPVVLWAFTLAGFWGALSLGQVYIPLLLLAVGAWLALKNGREILAGVLIGLFVAWKVNYLVWPVLLLLAGRSRSAVSALATFLGVSLVPVIIYGPQVYSQWFALASRTGATSYPTNASLVSITARLNIPWLGYLLAAGILLALAIWAWRARPDALMASGIALAATMVVSPIAWVHYSLFLLPVYFSLRWTRPVWVSAYLFTVPIILVNLMGNGPAWLAITGGATYAWATLALFAGLSRAAYQTWRAA